MADRPILFSGPMVRALIEERKTQTRRFLTAWTDEEPAYAGAGIIVALDENEHEYRWSRTHAVGDRLYVREAWHAARSLDSTRPCDIPRDADIEHAATARSYAEIGLKGKLRPGMFMPKWASRLTLIVTDVRVQQLQDISEADATAEGTQEPSLRELGGDLAQAAMSERQVFQRLWDSLNAKRGFGWDENPWVAAYTFRPILGNIDQIGGAS